MTTKDKINEALGLSGGKSIDEMLDDLSIETKDNMNQLDDISKDIASQMQKVDDGIEEFKKTNDILKMSSLDSSMREVEDLISQSKSVYSHIVDNVLASELLDAELISALAKILESIHINIQEFINLYRDKQRFIEKIKLMVFAQNQKKELMELKHKQTIELLKMKEEKEVVDTNGSISNGSTMSQEEVTKMLAKMSGAQLDIMLSQKEDLECNAEDGIADEEKEENTTEKET